MFINFLVVKDDLTLGLQHLKCSNITAEEFDLNWRKCAQIIFNQILEFNNLGDVMKLWPQQLLTNL